MWATTNTYSSENQSESNGLGEDYSIQEWNI